MSDTNNAVEQLEEDGSITDSEAVNTGSVKRVVHRGTVKWFNDAKGFGFIEHSSGKDVFVHYSVIEWDGFKTLKDGEEVEYELKEGEKGLHAAKVSRPNVKPEAPKADTSISEEISEGDNSIVSGEVETRVQSLSDAIEVERLEDTTRVPVLESDTDSDEEKTSY